MTTSFRNSGEVGVLASASDKNFLRINLADGLMESYKLNHTNVLLLGTNEMKIFEIGTVFKKDYEEMRVAYNAKGKTTEIKLEEFCKNMPLDFSLEPKNYNLDAKFKMWSSFPFIARDIAVWVPEEIKSENVAKIIIENMGDMVIRGPELFDEFKKGNQISYAFRLVFQSYERTLTDAEVNDIMTKITNKIKGNAGWQVR
jgi:phenylalanyl-tRNA synthetase beta subunit